MVEGKPPCSPTDDRCCQCGVYVCSECTTGLYPGHSASQGAHCCKVSVASWVESLHVRCGTCAWVHLRVTVLPGVQGVVVVWLVSVDARGARVRLYALCGGVAMGADAVFAAALDFLWSGTLRLGRAMVADAPHNSVNSALPASP